MMGPADSSRTHHALSCSASDYRGDPALEGGGSHFGASAGVLDELVAAGVGLFATATNHALDYSFGTELCNEARSVRLS
jgi:hypothetical protein